MSLINQIQKDILSITTNSTEFGVAINLEAPTAETIDIIGLHTKHHLGIDTDGNQVNTKNAHISFSEDAFIDSGYPIRNLNGEVSLKNHIVTAKDSTGNNKKYIIREWFPDETIGLIVCILGDYE